MDDIHIKIAESVLAAELAINPEWNDLHGYRKEQESLFNVHNDPKEVFLCPACSPKFISSQCMDDLFNEGLSLTPTLGELCFWAREGCAMCRFAGFVLLYEYAGIFRLELRDGLNTRLDIKLRGEPCKWAIRSFELTLFGQGSSCVGYKGFTALADDGSPAKSFVVKSHRTYLDFAELRLSECTTQHEHCRHEENVSLPTRVLETISEDGMPVIRLRETKGQAGQYSTLSYCWGGDQEDKLLKARLEAYKDNIEESSLPQTVRDAIYVTRRLKIRYLWIDAYCIVQDSTEDKSFEIKKMASIYKNAYLGIEASSASSSKAGFLHLEKPERLWPLPLRLPNGQYGTVLLRYRTGRLIGQDMPIDKRAWTMQERYLSPRTLLFPSDTANIVWECKEVALADFGTLWKPENRQLPQTYNWILPESNHIPIHRCMWRWARVVHDYSRRALSVGTDKLPAISAIAAEFHSYWEGEYFCGLWGRFLVPQLLWSCSQLSDDRSYWLSQRSYRAPSWSWASSDQNIDLESRLYEYSQYLEILEIHVDLVDPDFPFGEIKYASLRARGLLKMAILRSKEDDEKWQHEEWEIWDVDGGKLTDFVYLDTRTYTSSDGNIELMTWQTNLVVWCLAVTTGERDSDEETIHSDDSLDRPSSAAGLILMRLEQSGGVPFHYYRIGMYHGEVQQVKDDWCQIEDITIV